MVAHCRRRGGTYKQQQPPHRVLWAVACAGPLGRGRVAPIHSALHARRSSPRGGPDRRGQGSRRNYTDRSHSAGLAMGQPGRPILGSGGAAACQGSWTSKPLAVCLRSRGRSRPRGTQSRDRHKQLLGVTGQSQKRRSQEHRHVSLSCPFLSFPIKETFLYTSVFAMEQSFPPKAPATWRARLRSTHAKTSWADVVESVPLGPRPDRRPACVPPAVDGRNG